jgi:hypothetical protein
MEMIQLLLTGSLAGLVSLLIHSTLWSAVAMWRKSSLVPRAEPGAAETVLHMLCGILLALLFWLSWGLAAIVEPRWWLRGLMFGGLTWAALALPSIASIAFAGALDLRAAILIALRWATTTVVVGLACAWSWHQAV